MFHLRLGIENDTRLFCVVGMIGELGGVSILRSEFVAKMEISF